jgi:predicted XRE-type DNA-binding protein
MNMTDSNSTALRGALARAIKSHVEMKGLNGVQAAKECGIANSRMSTILRGQVEKISSDALVDILGTLGYRLDSVIGATEGHEFTLTLDEVLGLPKDIEPPVVAFQADNFSVINDNAEGKPFEVLVGTDKDGYVISSEVVMSNELEDSDPDADRVQYSDGV